MQEKKGRTRRVQDCRVQLESALIIELYGKGDTSHFSIMEGSTREGRGQRLPLGKYLLIVNDFNSKGRGRVSKSYLSLTWSVGGPLCCSFNFTSLPIWPI